MRLSLRVPQDTQLCLGLWDPSTSSRRRRGPDNLPNRSLNSNTTRETKEKSLLTYLTLMKPQVLISRLPGMPMEC